MSHEDADAEQDTCCRDDLAHSFPPCLTGESSTGSFPDDFAEGKYPPAEPGALGIGPLEAATLNPKLCLLGRRTKYALSM